MLSSAELMCYNFWWEKLPQVQRFFLGSPASRRLLLWILSFNSWRTKAEVNKVNVNKVNWVMTGHSKQTPCWHPETLGDSWWLLEMWLLVSWMYTLKLSVIYSNDLALFSSKPELKQKALYIVQWPKEDANLGALKRVLSLLSWEVCSFQGLFSLIC